MNAVMKVGGGFLASMVAAWAYSIFEAVTNPHGAVPLWFLIWFLGSLVGFIAAMTTDIIRSRS